MAQAEKANERNHFDLQFIDGKNYDTTKGRKDRIRKNKNETERDEINKYRDLAPGSLDENKLYNELSEGDKALIFPGEHQDPDAMRSKYDTKDLDNLDPKEQSARIWAKKDENEKGAPIMMTDERDEIEDAIDLKDTLAPYIAKIHQLPDRDQAIINLYLEGYTQTMIAAKIGVSQPMIYKILKRVINKLRN